MIKDVSWTRLIVYACFYAEDHGLPNLMNKKSGHIQYYYIKNDECCLRTFFIMNSKNSHSMYVTILFTELYIMLLTYTCRHTFLCTSTLLSTQCFTVSFVFLCVYVGFDNQDCFFFKKPIISP